MTYLYTVLGGHDVRVPIDLRTRAIDWLHVEPVDEPPLRAVGFPLRLREIAPTRKRRPSAGQVKTWQRNKDRRNANQRAEYALERRAEQAQKSPGR